jgi:amino acid transporter
MFMPDIDSQIAKVGEDPQDITSKTASINWVKNEIATAKDELRKEAENAIQEQVQTDKASLITVFGIFASIISFLTIEFQFLKTVCSLDKIIGFTLILFALLFGFNVALDYLIKSRLDKKTSKPNTLFSVMVFVILAFGIYMSSYGNEQSCSDSQIYLRYSDEFEAKFYDQEKTLDNRLSSQDDKINSIQAVINTSNIKK